MQNVYMGLILCLTFSVNVVTEVLELLQHNMWLIPERYVLLAVTWL